MPRAFCRSCSASSVDSGALMASVTDSAVPKCSGSPFLSAAAADPERNRPACKRCTESGITGGCGF